VIATEIEAPPRPSPKGREKESGKDKVETILSRFSYTSLSVRNSTGVEASFLLNINRSLNGFICPSNRIIVFAEYQPFAQWIHLSVEQNHLYHTGRKILFRKRNCSLFTVPFREIKRSPATDCKKVTWHVGRLNGTPNLNVKMLIA